VKQDLQLTATAVAMGTVNYMAPSSGATKSVDGRADIYSLGVILYELLTGELPIGRFKLRRSAFAASTRASTTSSRRRSRRGRSAPTRAGLVAAALDPLLAGASTAPLESAASHLTHARAGGMVLPSQPPSYLRANRPALGGRRRARGMALLAEPSSSGPHRL